MLSCRFLLPLQMETNKKRNSMDTIQLTISKQQFFGMLQAMPEQDKLEVFDRLRRSLFVSRFDRLLKSVRTDELSLDDITREVQRLKNNIEFFSSASTDNPLVREVNKNIERKSQALEQWKEKLAYMRQIQL